MIVSREASSGEVGRVTYMSVIFNENSTLLRFVFMPALCSTGVLCVGHMIKTPQNYEMKGEFPQAIVV